VNCTFDRTPVILALNPEWSHDTPQHVQEHFGCCNYRVVICTALNRCKRAD